MADILIRGMEMPTGCASCDFAIYKADSAYHYCFWLKQVFVKPDARLKSCPLHELPPHGDLIDRDALLAEYERDERAADEHGREFSFSFDSGGARCTEWGIVQQKLMDAPVVVPAEKGE